MASSNKTVGKEKSAAQYDTEVIVEVGASNSANLASTATADTTASIQTGNSNEAQPHTDDFTRAIRASVRHAVGAFRVSGPGNEETNIEASLDSAAIVSNQDQDDDSEQPPVSLPPYANIDIIAEATLVVDCSSHLNNEVDASNYDTLGLDWDEEANRGGAGEDSASVAVSAITTPYTPTVASNGRRRVHATTSNSNNGASSHQGTIITASLTQGSSRRHVDGEGVSSSDDTNNRGSPSSPKKEPVIADATPLNSMSIYACGKHIQLKKWHLSVLALVTLAAIAIPTGIVQKNKKSDEAQAATELQERTKAAADFCGANCFPQVFYENYPSLCSEDELKLGGTIQQAIANVMHRPHPFCNDRQSNFSPEFDEFSGEAIMIGPHLCQVSNMIPDISLINGGAIRGEIPQDTIITRQAIRNIYPFHDTIAYLQVSSTDLVKMLNNAFDFLTQEDPYNIYHSGAYPYASGLRFDVDLSKPNGTKAFDVEFYNDKLNRWVDVSEKSSYWIVSGNYVAIGGDNYLTNGVNPLYIGITELSYGDAIARYVKEMDGDWAPPSLEEMSTTSFQL